MALYFLEYDLRKQRDYKTLYEELARFNAVRVLESLWCFNRINTNAVGLRDYFMKLIDGDDGIMVSEVSDWACSKAKSSPSDLK